MNLERIIKTKNFIKIFKEKCSKEHANFDKEFWDIRRYNKMEKEDYINALQDAGIFKEKFLIPHYKMYNLLSLVNQTIFNLRQQQLTEIQMMKNIEYLEEIKTQMANSRIEIYFCNVLDNGAVKILANLAMPYGLLHVGLSVDDVVIQWGRSVLGKSLINPSGNVIYNDYIFAIELENQPIWSLIKETFDNLRDYITNKKDYNQMGTVKAFNIAEEQVNIIAENAVKYNVENDYSLVFKNCQHFAQSTIEKLKLNVNIEGEVEKVLKIARDKLNKFTFSFKGNYFETRKDLDTFVLIHDFEKFSKSERRVLFCFRNVFDYYARFDPKEIKYKTSEIANAYWNDLAEKEKFG